MMGDLFMSFFIVLLFLLILLLSYKIAKLKEMLVNEKNKFQEVSSEWNRKFQSLESKAASISKVEHLGHQVAEIKEDMKLTNYYIRHAVKELQDVVFRDATMQEESERTQKLFFNDKAD